MEFAYDNKIPGKKVKVYAKELKKVGTESSSEKSKQYTCTICGEYVKYYSGNIQEAHFRHIRGSFIAKTCINYVSENGISTSKGRDLLEQKMLGFPLYIRKDGDIFKLYIGLLPIPEKIILHEIKRSQKIEIKNIYGACICRINLNKLNTDKIEKKQLGWLYESYYFTYTHEPTPMIDKYNWIKESYGIEQKGAIFICDDEYCPRIKINGEITTDTFYYLVTPSNNQINENEIKFLKTEPKNKLDVNSWGNKNWCVYKIKFTEVTKESSEFARDLNLTLIEKPQKQQQQIQSNNQHIHREEKKERLEHEKDSKTNDPSLQKLSDFPLYIRKLGESFELSIGLLPVPESTINDEIESSQEIVIKGPNSEQFDQIYLENLLFDEITHHPLDYLYKTYHFEYRHNPNPLTGKYGWFEESYGIEPKGALFFCSDMFSRRIAFNGKITTDTYYYLVIPSKETLSNKRFLSFEPCNILAVKSDLPEGWFIYKIKFTEITNESSEFARGLNLTLVEKPEKLTPLWPPHIQYGNQHIYKKNCYAQYLLESSKPVEYKSSKEILHYNNQICIKKINAYSNIISPLINENEAKISLEGDNTQFNPVIFCKPSIEIPTYSPPAIMLQYGKKELQDYEELQITKKSGISCKSNYKCSYCHIRNSYLKTLITNELAIPEISDIKQGDTFLVLHGLDIISRIHFPKKNGKQSNELKKGDNQMYQTLIQLKGKQIATPAILKYVLPEPAEYPKVKSYILNSLRTGKIPKTAYDYIISNITGGISK